VIVLYVIGGALVVYGLTVVAALIVRKRATGHWRRVPGQHRGGTP